MATVESLSRKLRVGEELRSVVGTMKGLSAVAIHDYERAVRALREYTTTIELGFQILFMARPEAVPVESPPRGRTAMIVIGTDQGLCGPLNREIAGSVQEWADEHAGERGDAIVACLGVRMARELESSGLPPTDAVALPSAVDAIGPLVEDLVVAIDAWRREEDVARALVFFQHPIRRTQRTPRMLQVVPPDADRLAGIAARPWPTGMLPTFPHEGPELLRGLLRQDLFIALYRAVAEAKAAEHGARLSAMQAAEQNIDERLDGLRRQFHELRQAEITAQLLDVVSGFEVLRDQ